MCGIAGYFGPKLPEQGSLEAAGVALRHRGPDGAGTYRHQTDNPNGVALVHQRLAVIDLDHRSDQPMRVDDGVLVFNGEIYNYIELRRTLEGLGHRFVTDGDTEVLARALRHWGETALDRLEGMWAFAWYDERNGSLLLSRDRFGEKPLYLWERDGGLYFASEVKGLAALTGEWPEVNQNHLLRYLVNGYKALYKVSETFRIGVKELPRATCLTCSAQGRMERHTYWKPMPQIQETMSYEAAVERTREAMIDAVRLRMRSDVPLAFCMSGGVDSNCLIATASRELGCDVHGFTIVNRDERYEEQDLVELAVRELGIRHTPVYLEQRGFLDNLKELVRAHDAPVSTISYYTHWQLMRAVADQGYKVTISGTAADELFTGYYDHHNLYLHDVASDTELHKKSRALWQKHLAPIVRNPYLQDPDLYLKDPTVRDHVYLNNSLFSEWTCSRWMESFQETDFGTSLLRNRMLNELFAEAVPVILHEDDLNAMYFSMENRSPFLDRKLFDVAYSIPVRHLVQNGRAKAILRDAMRGIVPDTVLDSRRKVGFNAPILDLLDVRDPMVREYLLDDSAVYGLVRKEKIEKLLAKDELPNSASKFLFYFLNVKMFLEHERPIQ
jgi:asparagine synthase (glutamine-hydrolysing)